MNFLQDCFIIIPAAGFGTRVGSPHAKELFHRPHTNEKLIDQSVRWAIEHGVQCLVITRQEKTELIHHLQTQYGARLATDSNQNRSQPLIQLIEVSGEWPESILKSQKYWKKYNLVWLPDSDFKPLQRVLDILEALKKYPYSFATFTVEEFSKWGVVRQNRPVSSMQNHFEICEKPKSASTPQDQLDMAWGLFGFQQAFGDSLLQAMIASGKDHDFKKIDQPVAFYQLDSFVDLTRESFDKV